MAWTTKFSGLPTLTDIINAEDSYVGGVFTMNPLFLPRTLSDGPIAYVSLSAIGADISQVLRVTGRLTAFNFFFDSQNLGGAVCFYAGGTPRTQFAFTDIIVDDAAFLPGSAGTWGSTAGASADPSLTIPPWLLRCYRNGSGSPYVIPDAGFGSWSIAAGQQSHWYSDDDGTTWTRLGDVANTGSPDRAGIGSLWNTIGSFTASGVVFSNLEVMQDGAGPPPASRSSDESATAVDGGTVQTGLANPAYQQDEEATASDWATPWLTSYGSKVLAGINKGGTNGAVLQRNAGTGVWDEIQDFAGASNLTVYDVQQLNADYAAACIPNDTTGAQGFFHVLEGGSWVDKTSLLPTYCSPHSLYVAGVDDIWIGGYRTQSGSTGETIWHYNGSSVTEKHHLGTSSTYKGNAIGGVNTNLVYLAGGRPGFINGRLVRIVNHSTVTNWDSGSAAPYESISVLDAGNIYFAGIHGSGYPGVQHFDGGSTFTDLGNPGGGSTQVRIFGLWARSTSEVWAAGDFASGGTGAGIWLWNGASWSLQQNPTWSGAQGRSATGLRGTGEAWFGVYGTTTQRALYWNGASFGPQETFATGSNIRKMSATLAPVAQNRSIRRNETVSATDQRTHADHKRSLFLMGGRKTTNGSLRQISFRDIAGNYTNILNEGSAGPISSIRERDGVLYACGSNVISSTAYDVSYILRSTSLGRVWEEVYRRPTPNTYRIRDIMPRPDGKIWFTSGGVTGYKGIYEFDPNGGGVTLLKATNSDTDVAGYMSWSADDDVWFIDAGIWTHRWDGFTWTTSRANDFGTGGQDPFVYTWGGTDVVVGATGNYGTHLRRWSGASWLFWPDHATYQSASQPPRLNVTYWGQVAGPSINNFYLAYSTGSSEWYGIEWRDRIAHWNGAAWTIVYNQARGTGGASYPTIRRDPATDEYMATFYTRIMHSVGGTYWEQVSSPTDPNVAHTVHETAAIPPTFYHESNETVDLVEGTASEGPRAYSRSEDETATVVVNADVSIPTSEEVAEGAGFPDKVEFPSSAVDTPFWQTPEIPSGTSLEDALGGFSDQHEFPTSSQGTDFWQTPPIPDGVVLPELIKPLGGGFSDSVFITLGSANYSADEQTTDSEGHPHLITYRPYLMYSGDISAEPWANPTTTNFTGYAADGTRYTDGVQDVGPVYAPWYSEVASNDRSSVGAFPTKYLIAVSRLELVIYDLANYPTNLDVWMRFRIGTSTGDTYKLLGRSPETMADARILNGVLIVSTLENGTDRGRLFLIDFRQDGQRFANLIGPDNHWMGVSGRDITDRDLASNWTTSGVSPSLRISPEYVYSMTAYSAADGSKYWVVVAGEDQGPDVIEVDSSGVPQLRSAATGDTGGDNLGNVRQVLIDRDGWLWHSYYGQLYRNGLKYQEGVVSIPSLLDPSTPMIDLGTTIWDMVDSENYIYAATDEGVYRIHRGTMDSRLLWTISGGGGVGKDNIPGSGEILVGTKPMVNQIRAYTLNGSGYLAVASKLDGGNLHGGVTLIRTNDETVLDSMEFPDLAEDGAYVGIPVGL